jgi:hypothetical protein
MKPLYFTDEDFDDLVNQAISFDYDAEATSKFFWSYYNRYKDFNFDFVDQLKRRIDLLNPERLYKIQNQILNLKFLSTLYKYSSINDSNLIDSNVANKKISMIVEAFYKFKEYVAKGFIPQKSVNPEITIDQQIHILDKFGFFENNPLKDKHSKLAKLVSLLLKRSEQNTSVALRNRYGYKDNQKSIEGLNKILNELGLEKL